jgi:predicted component of type VI protein secretion system
MTVKQIQDRITRLRDELDDIWGELEELAKVQEEAEQVLAKEAWREELETRATLVDYGRFL